MLNKYGIPLIVILFSIAGVLALYSTRKAVSGPGNTAFAFYVDEENGDESVKPVTQLPPLTGKSGNPSVVRAMKFSFDGGAAKTLYYLKYTDQAKAKLESMAPDDKDRPDVDMHGQLVRSPAAGKDWFPRESPQGAEIMAVPPNSGNVQPVFPKK